MKQAEITEQMKVLTKVSGNLVPVRVTKRTEYKRGRYLTRYRCCRCDNGQVLPKLRTAAALRPMPDERGARYVSDGCGGAMPDPSPLDRFLDSRRGTWSANS